MNFLKNIFTPPKVEEQKKVEDSLSTLSIENPEDGQQLNHSAAETNSEHSTKTEDRQSLWKILSSKLGMDVVVGVTLPIWLNEPTTVLQRQCEMIHFHELLTEAASFDSSLDRLAWIAVFAITAYNGTERFGKPFNPVLGETFEFVDEEAGLRFLAEQVSHHPPISAAHCEGNGFVFWQDSRPRSKFLGNSVDLDPNGKTHIYFPKTRDHFVYTPPTSRVNNLIIGRMWIDHFGSLCITNIKNGESCTLTFEKCGWLGSGRHDVSGFVKDANGNNCLQVSGKWSESVNVKWLDHGKEKKSEEKIVWRRPTNNSIGKHKMTEFAMKLLETDAAYQKVLPPTDSRLRADRIALEKGDMSEAGIAKHKIEERQRADKRSRMNMNEEWIPRWFKQIPEENGQGLIWVYCGDYWDQRKKKVELLSKLKESAAAKEELEKEKDELMASGIHGLACDFRTL